jgi:hypothetical protein
MARYRQYVVGGWRLVGLGVHGALNGATGLKRELITHKPPSKKYSEGGLRVDIFENTMSVSSKSFYKAIDKEIRYVLCQFAVCFTAICFITCLSGFLAKKKNKTTQKTFCKSKSEHCFTEKNRHKTQCRIFSALLIAFLGRSRQEESNLTLSLLWPASVQEIAGVLSTPHLHLL